MSNLLIIAWFVLAFLILRTVVALVNAASKPYLPVSGVEEREKVSLLVPARNEEHNLPNLLHSFAQLNYPDFEVWVCNDHSTDQTRQVLLEWQQKVDWVHSFDGETLPPNWSGKNFACHQLAQKATGRYWLFLDADVTLAPDALLKAVSCFKANKLSLLSIFPQQVMQTTSEKRTVPIMNWILLSLLPLVLVAKSKNPLFAAGNGQFMLFEAQNYQRNSWHERVKNRNVEDIMLVRLMKEQQERVAVLLGNGDVFCRMYQHYAGALQGFVKNVHEFFFGSRLLMLFFGLVLMSSPLLIFFAMGWNGLLVYGFLLVVNRLLVSRASHQKCRTNLLFHPLQMLFFAHLMIENIRLRITKKAEWKGRKITI
ncbi:glycosyltransferase [Sunxiuqinia sp. sy24]|uniref:glycosyltransferase n=1 Tax=Sunxiuqinia sp. sy24 TaxID=3461495 RepID=UPI00404605AF